MKLYVIRHGEVDVNAKGLLNGRNDSILNAKGIKQVKQASEILKIFILILLFVLH